MLCYGVNLNGLLFAFTHHNIKHLLVGFVHRMCADADKISYALVDVVVDDSFDAAYAVALHGEHGGKYCGADTRGEFESARRLSAVANHACKVGNHILHRCAHLSVSAAHKEGDATT